MSQLGRISGQLLKENLTRNGHDLTFDNDLLHLDVNNRRVGIKKTNPAYELDVNGTTQTTDLRISNIANIGNLTITGETITSNTGTLNLTSGTGDLVTYQSKLRVDSIDIENNVISTNAGNTNLLISPNGTGSVEIYANTNVYGSIHATGNIRADGNITIGDANTDNITINADVASNIIPDADNYYTLGNVNFQWKDVWVKNLYADNITTGDLNYGGVVLNLVQGNIYYVATNGDDTNAGQHQNDPFATVGKALSEATAGDTVYIYPGTYNEFFPLTVPAGVTVKGAGLRAVKIVPDSTTASADAFLLNGETTVEDLTVADFYSPGYAFKFATGMTVTSRSPYIRNITVLTKGTTLTISDPRGFASGDAGKGAYIDGSVVNAASKEASMLFHSVTFLCPGVDTIVATNGVRIEWLNSFTYFSNRSMYLSSGSTGFAGAGLTRLKLPVATRTGTWAVGNTVSYYGTDGTTVLASGTVDSIDGDWINLTGKVVGFQIPADRAPKTVTLNGDAKLSTAQKKFGTASLVLDGTGDFITLGSQVDFGYSTGDFTIEFFWRPTALGTPQVLLDQRTTTNDTAVYLEMNAAGNIRLFVSNAYRITSSVACTAGAWNHIALFRTGGTTKIAVNGTVTPTTWADATNYPARPFRLGASWIGSSLCTGYFDELRVVKGVTKYTTSVTVPTTQFLADTSTVLLLHFNGLNNSTNVIDDGVTFVDIRSSAGGTTTDLAVADYSDFGAEVRSIGSAAVYGNYGIYGDGDGVIAYLIGQNLAYIGNGKETTNDPNTVIQANEVVELNRAKIYYNSVDHKGDFRVGDLFYVNQATGEVSFTNSDVTIGTSLTFDNGLGDITYIDATKIETGDFRISNNTIETLSQDFNIEAASNLIRLNSNVNVTGNLEVAGDVTVAGNVVIGNQTSDTVSFVAGVNSDILPKLDAVYDLGTSSLRWRTLYTSQLDSGDIRISTNNITTFSSNSDLTLQASGSGKISVPSNNVQLDQNLTVNGATYLKNTQVIGNITQIGNVSLTGTTTQLGNFNLTGNQTITGYTQYQDIRISGNTIETTQSNSDLVLDGAGTGKIYVPFSNVQLDQNLTVNGTMNIGTLNVNTNITSSTLTAGDVKIETNYITTLTGNNDLELRAAGTGRIYVPSDNVKINNNLTVDGTTNLSTTNITGTLTHVGTFTHTGNLNQTGNTTITGSLSVSDIVQFTDVRISGNTIETTLANNDLQLIAAGTGRIYVPSDNVLINQDLTVLGTISAGTLSVTNNISSASYTAGDVKIETNYITTLTGNNDLELRAAGTGRIYVPSDNVKINNNLTVDGTTNLAVTNITGTLTHIGNLLHTGTVNQTGNTNITGSLSVTDIAQFTDIRISGNTIETTLANNDLRLEAAGTGKIYVPLDDVLINQNLTVNQNISAGTFNVTTSISSASYTAGDVKIETNYITTLTGNNDLELRAAGTGRIYVPSDNVKINNNLTVDGTTNLAVTNITGTLTHIGNVVHTGNVNQTGNTTITGSLSVTDIVQFTDIRISGNTIETTLANNDLRLEAAGTGKIYIPLDDVQADQTVTIVGLLTTNNITNANTVTSGTFSTGDISINTNTIRTTQSNSNLVLEAAGVGQVRVPTNNVVLGQTLTVNGLSTLAQTNITGTVTHIGNTTRTGVVNQTGNYTLTGNLTVTNDVQLEDINISENEITTTIGNNDLILGAAGTGSVIVPNNNVQINQNLTVTGTSTTSNIINIGQVTSGSFNTGDILISGNTIKTTQSNSNLELLTSGTGYVKLEEFDIQENIIRINSGNDMILQPNGTGIVSIDSVQSLRIPVGATGDRPITPVAGMIRFNTSLNRYEGYNGTTWIRIDGVEDADGNTYITAELTPGANDNTIRFVVNGTQVADLDATRFNVSALTVDQLNIDNNTISTTTANTDIIVSPNGTGALRVGNFTFTSNLITNTVLNSNTVISQTGSGYVKINSTGGFVIPAGVTAERPASFEIGMMRFNTQDLRIELYNGTVWVGAGAGAGQGVIASEAQEIGIAAAIILG